MRWTLAQAGLALFTAGTVGLVRPSLAQQSPYLPLATPSPAGKVRTDAHPYSAAKLHQAMPEEMKVELAWLADPATFPCRLGAYQDGENLKIRGFVPNEAVKTRAMEIAGKQTAMPLVDELRIYSSIPMPVAGVPVDTVLVGAAQVLVKQLGDKANPLELTASVSGQIVVTGTLPTLADQLAVSHCLWGVHGCTSVKNLVTVPGLYSTSTVSSKGSVEKKAEPVLATKVVTLPETKANPANVVTLPVAKAIAPKMVMTPDTKAAPTKVATAEAPIAPTGTEISKFKILKETKADASKETNKTLTLPSPSTEIAKSSQSVIITKTKDLPKPAVVSGATVVLPATTGSVVAPLSKANQPAAIGERKPSTSHETPASASVVAPLSEANQPVAANERKMPAPERKTTTADASREITAEVKMKDLPTKKVEPVSHATSIPAAKTSDHPEGAYVASGVITYEEATASSAPLSRVESSIARLKDRIQSVCGRAGKNVEVNASTGNRMTIKVECATREEGERLSKQILGMRELAPYEVSLDMKLVP